MITDCRPDPERLAPLKECMETYDVEGDDPEWPWNVLSLRTAVYSCGAICREDHDKGIHLHDLDEFALCERLAREAAMLMDGVSVGMGSESSDHFAPFFVVANAGTTPPEGLSEETIRRAFGGTIYPQAQILVEPLVEAGLWWTVVKADCGMDGGDEGSDCLRPWRSLVAWFGTQPGLREASFVMIGEEPLSDENGGCVFPRLALALTASGSLVGICGHVVHT